MNLRDADCANRAAHNINSLLVEKGQPKKSLRQLAKSERDPNWLLTSRLGLDSRYKNLEAKMLDQYQGTLFCVVNYNDGLFADCDIVDAVSINPEASIDDEFWLGPSGTQVHADLLGLDEEEFLAQYPVGRKFRMELVVRVIHEAP